MGEKNKRKYNQDIKQEKFLRLFLFFSLEKEENYVFCYNKEAEGNIRQLWQKRSETVKPIYRDE